MADLTSTRVFGKLTVMHEAIVKANAEITGNITASKFIGDGSQLTALSWGEITGAPATATRWPSWSEVSSKPEQATRWPTWSEVSSKPSTFTPSAHTHSLAQITDAGNLAALNTNASTVNFLRGDGTWATPPNTNTTYEEITAAEIDTGTASTARAISGRRMKYALDKKADVSHTHSLSQITDAGDLASLSTNASTANFLRGDGTWATPPNTNTTYSAGTGITLTGTTFSLADERFTSALSTKLGGIATGATANSTDAQLRARSTHTGTQAMSTVDGLVSALGDKVDTTDSRLSDSREWTATVVTQAEAQAGTATTERKWTAQRVAQAISALGLSIGTTATTAKAGNWMPTWADVTGKPTTFTPSAHTHSLSQITDAGTVASLSTTGSTTAFLRGDGTWATPPNTNTTYSEITTTEIDAGTASTARAISGRRMKYALDKKADAVHGHSISDVTGLQAGLDSKADTSYVNTQLGNKVDKTVSVVAGTGLTGGGTLAADRTLSVSYGTTAGTAAQGNDSRLSNSREWTAAEVSQAEAEAGTVTTARKWTAQRVRQAILGWWTNSAEKTKLDGIATGATKNATDAQLRARSSHTGTQPVSTITGLSDAATTSIAVIRGGVTSLPIPDTRSVVNEPQDFPSKSASYEFKAVASVGNPPSAASGSYAHVLTIVGYDSNGGSGGWPTQVSYGNEISFRRATSASAWGAWSTIYSTTNKPTAADVGAPPTSRTISAGTGLSGGGTLAANRTLSVNYGTTAGTAAEGNDSRIVNATPNSRQIIAGTGLTGGGTLAANRTLSVTYGTTAGTACQGNDSRLSDSREWTASVVSQAEAEAGTSTTARKWTAQRVSQAIAASQTSQASLASAHAVALLF